MKRAIEFVGTYLMNILVGADQMLNAIVFGDPDETVSSRLGKIRFYYKRIGNWPWFPWAPVKILVWLLSRIDPHHCEEAIEEDEGGDDLFMGDFYKEEPDDPANDFEFFMEETHADALGYIMLVAFAGIVYLSYYLIKTWL